jgi:hypothetical protein
MPSYEVQSPWDAAMGAAGSYLAGSEAKRQQQKEEERQKQTDAYQRALAQQSAARLQLEAQRGEREQTKFGEDEADRSRAVKLDEAVASQNAGLRYPKGWEKMSPTMQIAYLRKRQQAEQGIGNVKGFADTQSQIRDLETQITEQQRAAEIASLIHHRDVVQPQQFDRSLDARNRSIDAGTMRTMAQIGAAMDRLGTSENFAQGQQGRAQEFQAGQQERRFGHEDKTAAAKAKVKTGGLNPEYVKQWAALQNNPRMLSLPPKALTVLQASYYAYGGQKALSHIQDIAAGKLKSDALSPEEASQIVTVMRGGL